MGAVDRKQIVLILIALTLVDFFPRDEGGCMQRGPFLLPLADLNLTFMSHWLPSPAVICCNVCPSAFSEAGGSSALEASGCNTSAFHADRKMGSVSHGIAYAQGKAESSVIQSSFVNYMGLSLHVVSKPAVAKTLTFPVPAREKQESYKEKLEE